MLQYCTKDNVVKACQIVFTSYMHENRNVGLICVLQKTYIKESSEYPTLIDKYLVSIW